LLFAGFIKFLELLDIQPEEFLKCPEEESEGECPAYIADGR
jgi:hypothetical protein